MKKRKILALVLGVTLAISAVFTACQTDSYEKKVGATVFYAHETQALDLYDEIQLTLLETITGNVKWKSSDERVLTVENGKIKTYKEGTATVTASYNGKKQTQTFTVLKGENDLVLDFSDLPLTIGTEYAMNANLLYKGELADGAMFAYESGDESIVKIANGKAKALKVGETTVSVKASWRGVSPVAEKTVTCTVLANGGIVTDKHKYNLYVFDEIHGQKFSTECAIQAKAYVNGLEVDDADIVWSIADESIATVSPNGIVKALKTGITYVKGIWQSQEYGEYKTVNIPVEVKIPVLQTKDDVVVDLNKKYSPLDATKILGDGEFILGAENVATGKFQEIVDDGINTDGLSVGEYRYIFYNSTKTYGVEVNLIVADYVINNKNDFLDLATHYDASYIALTTDIRNVGEYTNTNYLDISQAFTGVFNGLGHTVYGMKVNSNSTGIFSHVSGATFKNIGFADVTLGQSQQGTLFYRTDGATTLDNVHIQVTSMNRSSFMSGVVGARLMSGKLKLTNVVVESGGLIGTNTTNGALLGLSNGILSAENVFVIMAEDKTLCGTHSHSHNRKFNEINAMSLAYKNKAELSSDILSGAIGLGNGFNDYWDRSSGLPSLF